MISKRVLEKNRPSELGGVWEQGGNGRGGGGGGRGRSHFLGGCEGTSQISIVSFLFSIPDRILKMIVKVDFRLGKFLLKLITTSLIYVLN